MGRHKNVIRLKIREVAESKKINPSKLSRMADVHYNTLQAIWRNPYHNIAMHTLERIAKALGVPVADLYVEEPDEQTK